MKRLTLALGLLALTVVLMLSLVGLGIVHFGTSPPESIPARLSVIPPFEAAFASGSGGAPWLTLSPDGRRMVFGAVSKDGKQMLFLRSLDSESPQPIPGTEDAAQPFWSPDGRFIAFFS